MIVSNVLINGKSKNIRTENGKFAEITEENIGSGFDGKGLICIPGLVDVHIHAFKGVDTMDKNFEPLCRSLAENGTTSFLPTTMTSSIGDLKAVTTSKTNFDGAEILGFHLEGPYISVKKKGAQNEEYIKKADYDEFKKIKNVKMITVSPETDGALDFIKKASKSVSVAIGHTDCDYETASKAIDNGANNLTHTFNAMPPFLHRETGPIGAAFDKGICAQLICDGLHVSSTAVRALYKMFSAEKIALISDSIRPSGLEDGKYESGGLDVYVKNGECRLIDGTLAGGSFPLLHGVKKAVEFGIKFEDAVKSATEVPAKLIGVNKGKIKKGYDADFLLLDEHLNLVNVFINSKQYK